jgi:hypothetical protein
MDLNNGYSSAAPTIFSSQTPLQLTLLQLITKLVSGITPRHGRRRRHRLLLYSNNLRGIVFVYEGVIR